MEPTTHLAAQRRAVYERYNAEVTRPIPTRFTDDELSLIDELVEAGVADSRSGVIRRGVHHLADSVRRAHVGAAIAESYRATPQSADDDALAMASALALTEAEPW